MTLKYGKFEFRIGYFFIVGVLALVVGFVAIRSAMSEAKKSMAEGSKPYDAQRVDRVKQRIHNENSIVVLDVNGVILTHSAQLPAYAKLTGVTFGVDFRETLAALARDGRVKGVIVKLSTPGGAVTGSREIHDAIVEFKKSRKPIHMYIVDLAASGGVYAMVAADHISSAPETLIGSIGVIGPRLMQYKNVKRYGDVSADLITQQTFSVGKGKDLFNPFADPDPEIVAAFEQTLKESYASFVEVVSSGRQIKPDIVRALGARIMTAQEAKRAHLIDAIESWDDAKKRIAEEAKCPIGLCDFIPLKDRTPMSILEDILGAQIPPSTSSAEVSANITRALKSELRLMLLPSALEQ